jgi:hypothetical protein
MSASGKKNPVASSTSSSIPFEEFSKWSPEQLTEYLRKLEVPVGDNLIKQRISGDIIVLMSDKDYDNLGYTSVGDVLRVKNALQTFQRKARSAVRAVAIWEANEYVLPSLCDQICCCFQSCYNADSYRLTTNNLQFKEKADVFCCGCIGPVEGPLASCLRWLSGSEFGKSIFIFFSLVFYFLTMFFLGFLLLAIDNVDLRYITDVDTAGKTANCCQRCCGINGQDVVIVQNKNGEELEKHELYVQSGEGTRVVTVIRDAVEECRMIR